MRLLTDKGPPFSLDNGGLFYTYGASVYISLIDT